MRIGSLFAGIGGFDLAAKWAGMETAWFSEVDPYASAVLKKHWPDVPNHGDIRNIKGADVEPIDILCGGFPCQDISVAGRGAGIEGERSGLWKEYARLIGELRPRYVVAENVSALRSRGLITVLKDLYALGYDAEWHCIPASAVGAPHQRDRVWIIAYAKCARWERPLTYDSVLGGAQPPHTFPLHSSTAQWLSLDEGSADVREGDGISVSMERRRLQCLGNALSPQIPYAIFKALINREHDNEDL